MKVRVFILSNLAAYPCEWLLLSWFKYPIDLTHQIIFSNDIPVHVVSSSNIVQNWTNLHHIPKITVFYKIYFTQMLIANHFLFCFLGTHAELDTGMQGKITLQDTTTKLPYKILQESILKEWNQREDNPICDQLLSVWIWIVLNCSDGSTSVKKMYGNPYHVHAPKVTLACVCVCVCVWERERETYRGYPKAKKGLQVKHKQKAERTVLKKLHQILLKKWNVIFLTFF